ncbi:MAG: DNA methylase [Lachnospiraceae bacterium]|nr:DNA methylase [Lachnospiraceae bacterium]
MDKAYIAIDLKSFYASVECVERKLNPLDACLVVADPTRTEKTICLAVSPGLKSYGVPGRPRLFEVIQKVKDINEDRRFAAPEHRFTGRSDSVDKLDSDPALELDYIVAPPRMALYLKYSTEIYRIYLKYVAPEDIHVYSCDEVFMDVTPYLDIYGMTPHELAMTMIRDVLTATGITATAGIGTNLYLCKVAMDIVAKKMPADKDGVRIAELDERSYREKLWSHTPLTDFWGIGHGTVKRLASLNLYTMGDLAEYSERFEDMLYRTFGVNAELLIDHAWGWEPCTIENIKSYTPSTNSLSSGQVLQRPYSHEEAAIIVREMTDLLTLDLVKKELVTDQMTLTINYEALRDPDAASAYKGAMHLDHYGRPVPKHAHGTANLDTPTSSSRIITEAVMELYERITDRDLLVRRVTVCAMRVQDKHEIPASPEYEQLDLFTDYEAKEREEKAEKAMLQKEEALQRATLQIKEKYGKNAILKGTNFLEGATSRERNRQIGGHKA